MNDTLHFDCYRHLTQAMADMERAAFERRLRDEPELARLYSEVAEGVARHFRSTGGDALNVDSISPDIWAGISRDVARTQAPSRKADLRLWLLGGLAAALALGNFAQWRYRAALEPRSPQGSLTGEVVSSNSRQEPRTPNDGEAREAAGTDTSSTPAGKALERERRLVEQLRKERVELERTREVLIQENRLLVDQANTLTVASAADGGRLSLMELVDKESYLSGKRHELLNTARRLLLTPGLVATGDGNNAAFDPGRAGAPGPATAGASGGRIVLTALGEAAAATAAAPVPYALSIFDEQTSEGYINFYDLPANPVGLRLYLWSKTEQGGYVLVGPLPAVLAGRSGSVYYQGEGGTKEILVTQESSSTTPMRPSGATVLRGP